MTLVTARALVRGKPGAVELAPARLYLSSSIVEKVVGAEWPSLRASVPRRGRITCHLVSTRRNFSYLGGSVV